MSRSSFLSLPFSLPVGRARKIVPVALAALLLGLSVGWAVNRLEPRRFGFPEPPQVDYPSYEDDGSFRFARIKFRPTRWGFGPYTWGLDLKWNHDYPQAEQNFTKIITELTGVVPLLEGGNIIELDDPRLFEHPWAYLCEPGFWDPTEEELDNLREYLAKGGFLVIDDFFVDRAGRPDQWSNFERQINRLFPKVHLFPLDVDQPIFRIFFELEDLDFSDPQMPWFVPTIYGVFEDNDPSKRLLVVVNYNLDIGDYWEWSDQQAVYPVHLTEKGFKLGINYLLYGMTH